MGVILGCFGGDGFFYVPSKSIDTASLEKLFIHKIFKMLLAKGFITEKIIDLISSWRHTGFGVYLRKENKSKRCKVTRVSGRIYYKGILFLKSG